MTPLLAACVTGHADIVDYLVRSNNLVSRKEKIEALELLGATYIDKKRDLIGGFDLWKQAMDLRFNMDDEQDIPKPDNALPIEAYEWAQEVKNHEELNELLSEPDEMRMQVCFFPFCIIQIVYNYVYLMFLQLFKFTIISEKIVGFFPYIQHYFLSYKY